jgi:hypothetical protein
MTEQDFEVFRTYVRLQEKWWAFAQGTTPKDVRELNGALFSACVDPTDVLEFGMDIGDCCLHSRRWDECRFIIFLRYGE